MEWIQTKTMVDLEELKAKMDINISDEQIEALVSSCVEDHVNKRVDNLDVLDEDKVAEIVSDQIEEGDFISEFYAQSLIRDVYEELERMIEDIREDNVCPDEFDRVSGSMQKEMMDLRMDVEIARRSIRLLLEERERSLSHRMGNLLDTARRRTLFTLTSPKRLYNRLRAQIKELL